MCMKLKETMTLHAHKWLEECVRLLLAELISSMSLARMYTIEDIFIASRIRSGFMEPKFKSAGASHLFSSFYITVLYYMHQRL